jgi:hypothetical protein
MSADRPRVWLRIDAFGRPVDFELRRGDNAHTLKLEDAARLTDVGEWLTERAIDPEHVPVLVEAVGKLQAIAQTLDERASRASCRLEPALRR